MHTTDKLQTIETNMIIRDAVSSRILPSNPLKSVVKHTTLRPFYFTVVFWGEVHRQYFLDLLLASLLSPNNLPALNPERRSKFLIVTTRTDWEALQSEPLFQQMQRHVEPVWFEMSAPDPDDLKMLIMSKGHKQVSMRAFADRAYGVFVTPDLVLSDGSVAAMQRLAEAGKKVVLAVAIRFAQEALLQEMEREGYFKPAHPLVLPGRDLMRMALKHLHTETLRYEFDSPYFADMPISVYWRVPQEQGIIIYSFSWAPLLVDYGRLGNHDTSTFDQWTLDGDYIHRNFSNSKDIYVSRDSDEMVLVSFTKESDLHYDLTVDPKTQWWNGFAVPAKAQRIRKLKDSTIMDPLKRSIFPHPVYLHSGDITPVWFEWQRRTDEIIASAYRQRDYFRNLEGQFVSDVYTYARTGQSRFSEWVIERCSNQSSLNRASWWLLISFWLIAVRPHRYVTPRLLHMWSILHWYWLYRRFVWWRLKEKLGIVEERHYKWRDSGWTAPGLSIVCPIYSMKWLWCYRHWLMKQLKPGGVGLYSMYRLLHSGDPELAAEVKPSDDGSHSSQSKSSKPI